MSHDLVVRIGSLVGKNKVRDAARHNLRELPPEPHIDHSRSGQNCVLHGAATAGEVARQADTLLADAGITKFRANAIRGIELLVCLPYNFKGDAMAFFRDALTWSDEFFQRPIVSCVAHFDESSPHLHVVMVPIVDGRLQGSVVMGDMRRIQAIQSSFYLAVGRKHGLRKKTAHRLSKAQRALAAQQVLDAVKANMALLDGGQVKRLLLDAISKNLDAFAASVGVTLPEPEPRPSKETFASIMTRPQKPERKQSPIGFHQNPIEVFGPAGVPNVSDEKQKPYALLGNLDLPATEPTETSSTSTANTPRHAHAAACSTVNHPRSTSGVKPASTLHQGAFP